MEGNKDFDKDKQEQGTQQMPKVGDGTGGDEEKKRTVTLFGREFDKRKAVMVGLGGLLAIALIGGGIWYATSQGAEPKDPAPIEQAEKTERHVIHLGAKADGWVKGESSPVIVHIVNKEEKVDYYHAYDANEPHALDVPEEGEYEVSFISPVDKDGSTYEVPKASKVKVEAEGKDGKAAKTDLPFEFKPIAADKTSADTLAGIVKSVGDAVKKGDETLTGANGTKVIGLVKENAKANPNADEDKLDEESRKAEENVGDGGNTSGTGNSGSNGGSGNSGSNGGSGNSSSGGESKPQHVHNWVAQTTVVHHDAVYETTYIHHDAVQECRSICNGCHADITGFEGAHMEEAMLNGNYDCGGWHDEWITVSQAWDEPVQKLVKEAWDETVTTGYTCSCGATK